MDFKETFDEIFAKKSNRKKVLNILPWVAAGILLYILMGFATSFTFMAGVYLLFASITVFGIGAIKLYEMLESWSKGGT